MSLMAPSGFTFCAGAKTLTPKKRFHTLVQRYFHGASSPPSTKKNAPRPEFHQTSIGRWLFLPEAVT